MPTAPDLDQINYPNDIPSRALKPVEPIQPQQPDSAPFDYDKGAIPRYSICYFHVLSDNSVFQTIVNFNCKSVLMLIEV